MVDSIPPGTGADGADHSAHTDPGHAGHDTVAGHEASPDGAAAAGSIPHVDPAAAPVTEPAAAAKEEGLLSRLVFPEKGNRIKSTGRMISENFAGEGKSFVSKLGRGAGAFAGGALAIKGVKDMVSKDEEGNRHVFKGACETALGAVGGTAALALQVKGKGAALGV